MATPQTTPETAALPLPPGKSGLPLLGETLDFVRSPARFIERRQGRHGNVFRTHLLGAPTVYLLGAEANRWIFAGEEHYLRNRWSAGVRQLLGAQCVAMLNGQEHRERRKLLAPHFGYPAMRAFVPEIEAIARRHLADWAAAPQPLTVFPAMRALAFEIAVTLIMGREQLDLPAMSRLFRAWTAGLFAPLTLKLPWTTFGKALKARDELLAIIGGVVARRQALAEQPADILGSLISCRDDAGQPLPRQTIVDEIQLQLFAGHDTTVAATSNLLLLLANHPEALARARAEQAGCPMGDEPLALEQIKAMPYLAQVISEGLRLIPPIGGAFRVTTEEVSYGGYRIPAGWTIGISPRAAHREPGWTDPDRFDPDRFGPERAEHKHAPCAFIPFGGGPRVCLGQHFAMVEMSVILALLLRGYRWELEPGQDLAYSFIPFPRPKSGIQVRFAPLG
ncbi:MAG TPA: cytochrome P450 [Herpetosiphonaceae bacterium]